MKQFRLLDSHKDERGKMFFLKYGKFKINIIEIKKGFARGGHYHKYEQDHVVLCGKIKYKIEDISTKQEQTKTISKNEIIHIKSNMAHVLIALEDSIIVESFKEGYKVFNYLKYRKIVEKKIIQS